MKSVAYIDDANIGLKSLVQGIDILKIKYLKSLTSGRHIDRLPAGTFGAIKMVSKMPYI